MYFFIRNQEIPRAICNSKNFNLRKIFSRNLMCRARFKLSYTQSACKGTRFPWFGSCTLRPLACRDQRTRRTRVLVAERTSCRNGECANLRVDAPFPAAAAFLLVHFEPGAPHDGIRGSVSPAIPLTRLRIVVLAREEGRRHRCMSPVVRVSAYLRWDFGIARARERERAREWGESERIVESAMCNENATGSEEFDSSKKRRRRNPSPKGKNYRAFRCSYRALYLVDTTGNRQCWTRYTTIVSVWWKTLNLISHFALMKIFRGNR